MNSEDFSKFKLRKKSQSGQNYVLPEANDYGHALLATENFTGKQVLNLSNLAICVPELLFRPSDIGVKCAGIAEAVVQSSELLTQAMREELLLNIVVVGGIAKTKGLCERLQQEIQENVSSPVKIFISEK